MRHDVIYCLWLSLVGGTPGVCVSSAKHKKSAARREALEQQLATQQAAVKAAFDVPRKRRPEFGRWKRQPSVENKTQNQKTAASGSSSSSANATDGADTGAFPYNP